MFRHFSALFLRIFSTESFYSLFISKDLYLRIYFQGFISEDFVDRWTSFGHTVSLCSLTLTLALSFEISAGSVKQRIITQHEIRARAVLAKSLKGQFNRLEINVTLELT